MTAVFTAELLLQECHETLVHVLMGNYFDELIQECFSGEARWQDWQWYEPQIEKIILNASPDESGFAYCPLCKHGVAFNGELRGFAYPEGLKRHLHGDSKARLCRVVQYLRTRSKWVWGKKETVLVDDIKMSISLYNALKVLGISTFEELKALPEHQLMRQPSIGKVRLQEYRQIVSGSYKLR